MGKFDVDAEVVREFKQAIAHNRRERMGGYRKKPAEAEQPAENPLAELEADADEPKASKCPACEDGTCLEHIDPDELGAPPAEDDGDHDFDD